MVLASPRISFDELRRLHEQTRPTVLAAARCLPVVPELATLLPDAGLRRGTVVEAGTLRLAFRLAAAAVADGSWAALLGVRDPGLAAAAELGVTLERLVVVDLPPDPGAGAAAAAALVDALDVVVVGEGLGLRPVEGRRLAARVRERAAVVIAVGAQAWPEAVDVRCTVRSQLWDGLGDGHGHLRQCRGEVVVDGRRGASRPRTGWVWLGGEVLQGGETAVPAPGPAPPAPVPVLSVLSEAG